jgi:hypothetical protein
MSALTLNLPDNLYEKAMQAAASKNLSIDSLMTVALTQTLSRLLADPVLEERAARATGEGLAQFLAQVPTIDPPELDALPEGYQPTLDSRIESAIREHGAAEPTSGFHPRE